MSEYYKEFKTAYEKDGFIEGAQCQALNEKYKKRLANYTAARQPGRAKRAAVSVPPNTYAEPYLVSGQKRQPLELKRKSA